MQLSASEKYLQDFSQLYFCLYACTTGIWWLDISHGTARYCCNLSGGVALNVWFTTKNNTHIYVAQTSNDRMILWSDLYCCLVPYCEALCTCYPGFLIAIKWCCDQECEGRAKCSLRKKNMRSMRFIVKRRGCCCNLSGSIALIVWFTTNGMCAKNNTHIYVARISNNRVISSDDLYCCLLPQCEALRTCHSGFAITTI